MYPHPSFAPPLPPPSPSAAASKQTLAAAAKVPGLTAAVVVLSLLVAALLGATVLGATLAGVWWMREKKRGAVAQHALNVSGAAQSGYSPME